MQAYSMDLRQHVAQALTEPGARQAHVAARFCVSLAFVSKLVRRQRQTGSVAALPGRGGPPRCLDAAAQAWLAAQVGRQPDATLAELRDALQAETGRRVSVGVVWRVLNEQNQRRKKSLHATERVRELRHQHVEAVAARTDVHRFYFLDETGLRLDYTRHYARATSGRRVSGAVPLRRGRAVTLIGALGVHGLTALQLLDGVLNQRSFAFYVARVLGPQLSCGDVLVLDNLPVHKLSGLRQELTQRGVEVLFLPPYSPNFTPVEQAWSKLKTKLRQAQTRTHEALQAAIQTAVNWISSKDAEAWFNHCGYHVHRS